MRYWVLDQLPDEYNCAFFDVEKEKRIYIFDGTSLLDKWDLLPVNFIYKSRKKGDCPWLQLLPFFSPKAIKILKDLMDNNVEYLPVTGEASKFVIVNVLKVIDALDKEKTIFDTLDDGTLLGYEKLVLQESKVNSEHIFKLTEFPRTYVIVSNEFKKRVEEMGLKGFTFEEIEVI